MSLRHCTTKANTYIKQGKRADWGVTDHIMWKQFNKTRALLLAACHMNLPLILAILRSCGSRISGIKF